MPEKSTTTWAVAFRGEGTETLDIDIYDTIGGDGMFSYGITARDIRNQLKYAANAKQINVRLNSGGGDVTEGMAIYSMLTAHGAKVCVKIDALAASIASIIAMAGDEIEMAEGSFMMIHNPFAMTMGESDDLRKTADLLDKMRDQMIAIYHARTGQTENAIGKALDAETWMAADEAKKLGYATVVRPAKGTGKKTKAAAWDLHAYAKVPDAVTKLARLRAGIEEERTMDPKDQEIKDLKDKLEAAEKKCADLEAASAPVPVAEAAPVVAPAPAPEPVIVPPLVPADSAPVLAAVMNLTGESTPARMVAALKAHATANASLTARIAALESVAHETSVSAAIAKGKILPAQKAWAVKQGAKAFGEYLVGLGDAVVGPVGVEYAPPSDAPPATGGEIVLTKAELEACKAFNNKPEDYLAAKKLRIAAGGK